MARTTSTGNRLPQPKPAMLRTFHAQLLGWYATHGRHDLPWRKTADPYAIWISEVMLQQTQVATVLARFYHPFLDKFPTVASLAAAPRDAVMKAWEGLGYYRRAGFLHEAAKQAGKRMPQTIDGLLALPGIGQNTAHAVAAFAYHQPVAILEANVKRIVARIFALETPSDKELWAGAEKLLNRAHPFDHNQAMMDLGATLCTPKKPACGLCPAQDICGGKTAPERYPTPKAKKQVPTREMTILVREDANGRLFLEPREAALLGGLYGFPQSPVSKKLATPLGTITHTYSHFKLIGHVVHEKLPEKMNAPNWHSREEIATLPLSTADHKVLALVEACHTGAKKSPKRPRTRATR